MGCFDTSGLLCSFITKLFVISRDMAPNPRPTESELAILNVLWNEGPSTVHEVRDTLERDAGYTTILKLMQIMFEKGLVDREKEGRAHRYHPLVERKNIQHSLLDEFTNRLFGGSMGQLIQRAITSEELDREEINEIKNLLEKMKSEEEEN